MMRLGRWITAFVLAATLYVATGCHNDREIQDKHQQTLEGEGEK